MATALVILAILGCAAYHYFRGGIIKSFAMIIITISSSIIAFGFFEALASLFISRAGVKAPALAQWSFALSFILIYTLSFSLQQALIAQFTKKPAELGDLAEKILRPVLGAIFGFLLSGVILTALAMAPLPTKYSYERFDKNNITPARPKKSLFNSDGFIVNIFSVLSRGAFNSEKNFASIHPNFLDQVFINKLAVSEKIPIVSIENEISLPLESPVWFASKDLKDEKGNPIAASGDNDLIAIRLGFKKPADMRSSNIFLAGQIRLVCKPENEAKEFSSSAKNIYPVAFIKTASLAQKLKLKDQFEIKWDEFTDKLPDGSGKWIDFLFELPKKYTPMAVEFRQNSFVKAPPPSGAEKALPSVIFIPPSQCATESADVAEMSSSAIYGIALTTGAKFLDSLALEAEKEDQWKNVQSPESIEPPKWSENKFDYARAELIIDPNNKQLLDDIWRGAGRLNGIAEMLRPRTGYKLLSLKCTISASGSEIRGQDLPSLVDINGRQHKAVGVIASGKKDDNTIYEIDYCALSEEEKSGGLEIDEKGVVTKPFPDTIWISQKVSAVSEFYVLYMIKPAPDMILNAVKPADSATGADFKGYQGFLVK